MESACGSRNTGKYTSLQMTVTPRTAVAVAASAAVCGVAAATVLHMYWTRRKLKNAIQTGGKAVDDETPWPLVGNTPSLASSFFGTLYRHVHESVFLVWVGSTPFIVLNDLKSVRRVLTGAGGVYSKPKYFGYRSKAIKSAVERERKAVELESAELAAGDFSRTALEALIVEQFGWLNVEIEALAHELAARSDHDQQHAFQQIQQGLVHLNLRLLYKFDDAQLAGKVSYWIAHAGLEFAKRMANPFRAWYHWAANVRFLAHVSGLIGIGRRLCKHLDDIVAAERKDSELAETAPSWVHAWLGKVGKIGKLGKVVGLLMASTQTVPLTAIWSVYLVATHESVRNKILAEVRKVNTSSACVDLSELDSLTFLDAVVRETLRIYPPFPVLQREAQMEDELSDGAFVQKGQIVYIVPWLIHHNPKIWRNPEAFEPERFVGNASHGDAENDYAFIPFGRGSRMCAGYRLAIVEVKLLLLHLVLNYDWEAAYESPEYPAINMVPSKMQFTFRAKKISYLSATFEHAEDASRVIPTA
ncbi:Cytochrome P450 71D18 [Porphyridium purpureum]|uniref:Cytochrome P450 71D18 n=1 Tax=Porphyridium purpureum TaxID=35688 RepID=A0A5J4YWG1_PORPP|nr:Cytochrome P450 71D18 [Porphyridium purpureum]|eukprot:POR1950..scf227_4